MEFTIALGVFCEEKIRVLRVFSDFLEGQFDPGVFPKGDITHGIDENKLRFFGICFAVVAVHPGRHE